MSSNTWEEALIAECDEKTRRIAQLERDLDTERMRLAGCGTAALGYHRRTDRIAPEYVSAALNDVLRLYERWEAADIALRAIYEFRLTSLATTCPDCEPGCDHGAAQDVILRACKTALGESL